MQPDIRNLRSSISILALVAVGFVLAAPLLQGETLCTDDGALHIYRTVALDRALADGVLFPRWFPDLAYGYGFPFFIFREPLGYYALEGLHLLGVSVPNALNLVLAGSLIFAGLSMYLLARDIFGPRGGLLSGIAYVTAPYALIGPLTRGNLPEVMAYALMPLILFLIRRLIVFRWTRYFVASILAYAALFLTHNISSLLFTPLLLVYVAIVSWTRSPGARTPTPALRAGARVSSLRSTIRHSLPALLAIALTLGLTAYFWLPALAEQSQAQVYLTHSARGNDYHFNFISLGELLGGPGTFDPKLLNPPLHIPFGWMQLLLAALGTLAHRRAQTREQRATIAATALATIALSFMALPASLSLWDSLPLIRFVQFPWRFVGRAMLPASLLAAAVLSTQGPTNNEDTKTRRNLGAFVSWWSSIPVIFVALLFTAPLSYPRQCPTPHDLDMTDMFAYERASGHIGVDPLGAYLPRAVTERPTESPLEAQYASGAPIQRFDATSLPGGARVLDAQYGPNRADLTLAAPIEFTATYLTFAFPGWQVWIDDQAVAITPSDSTGLITFKVPPGEHRIHVEFGDSPPRALADGVSLAAIALTIASVILISRRSHRSPTPHLDSPAYDTHHALRFTLFAFIAMLAFVLVKALLIDPGLTPLRATRLAGDTLSGVSHPLDIAFGDQLRLLGFDVEPSVTRPGETIRVDLYWKAVRPLDTAYQAEVGVADAGGWPWSPKHAERPRDYNRYPPTSAWPLDAYAIDSFEVEVLPGTPPGDYAIVAHLFDRDTLASLAPSVASGLGRLAAPIGTIRVERATQTFDSERLRIYGGERIELDADLTLLGYNIDRVDMVPGESALLTFFWQAERAPQSDRVFRIDLIDASNDVLMSMDRVIGGESYPTSRWIAGEQIISPIVLRVPAATPSGEHHWRGSLLDASGQPATSFDMQPTFNVTAPVRTFDEPALRNQVRLEIGDFAELLGFDLLDDDLAPGDTIDLVLYWLARAETETTYKVFVHVLNAEGLIVAQADAMPAGGLRPTTGWLPGEVIADSYSIALPVDLPTGTYQIAVGMYNPEDSTRLRTSEGGEAIMLSNVEAR